MKLEYVLPEDIEKRSFEIIEEELGENKIPDDIKPIVMRVIHTTADFDYYNNLCFSESQLWELPMISTHFPNVLCGS